MFFKFCLIFNAVWVVCWGRRPHSDMLTAKASMSNVLMWLRKTWELIYCFSTKLYKLVLKLECKNLGGEKQPVMIIIQATYWSCCHAGSKQGECFKILKKFVTSIYSFSFFSSFIRKFILFLYLVFLVLILTVKNKMCLPVREYGLISSDDWRISRHTWILFKKIPYSLWKNNCYMRPGNMARIGFSDGTFTILMSCNHCLHSKVKKMHC